MEGTIPKMESRTASFAPVSTFSLKLMDAAFRLLYIL